MEKQLLKVGDAVSFERAKYGRTPVDLDDKHAIGCITDTYVGHITGKQVYVVKDAEFDEIFIVDFDEPTLERFGE